MGVGQVPEIHYTTTDDGAHVAYQVVGDGPLDIVYANSFMSHIEFSWEYPRGSRSTSAWRRSVG